MFIALVRWWIQLRYLQMPSNFYNFITNFSFNSKMRSECFFFTTWMIPFKWLLINKKDHFRQNLKKETHGHFTIHKMWSQRQQPALFCALRFSMQSKCNFILFFWLKKESRKKKIKNPLGRQLGPPLYLVGLPPPCLALLGWIPLSKCNSSSINVLTKELGSFTCTAASCLHDVSHPSNMK